MVFTTPMSVCLLAPTSQYKATFRPELVKDFGFIRSNVDSKNPVQVVDARSSGRFKGVAPEPRPDIPSGHIAKTTNIPFFDCFNDAKTMKKPEELQKVFEEAGIDLDKDVVATCGSGVTACVLAYAAFLAKGKEVPVYDGAWVEWALKVPDLIIAEKPTIS